MWKLNFIPIVTLYIFCVICIKAEASEQEKKTYIIHMDKSYIPSDFDDHEKWYDASLKSISDSADLIYSYNIVIHGYSAKLSAEEAELLQRQPGVVSVQEDAVYELHTTRSPGFLGLDVIQESYPTLSNKMSQVVIGFLDTGVWPEIKSFNDEGLGPPPSSWKGVCETGKNFKSSNCNRKIIGARFFYKGYEAAIGKINETMESKSPRDDNGHGTHTASTAAGASVTKAELLGYATGTARGMATDARIAIYKVCWSFGCVGADVLAAMEKAVEDGVHILSLSLGGSQKQYFSDNIAIGAFTAMSHGIFVSCSAGNSGPDPETLSNVAPWITTVAAGTMDREFPAYISLGNGRKFSGASLYNGKPLVNTFLPLVYAGNATNSSSYGNFCVSGTLIPKKVAGKIVVCDRGMNEKVEKGLAVKEAGGLGTIVANINRNGEDLIADAHVIPAANIGIASAKLIKKYIFSEAKPTAKITFAGTKLGVQPSPIVATFSSRGPNIISTEILKPDLLAPGVNILAGWTGKVSPTEISEDKRRVSFNIISGTSMSCPHVSGIAALVKAIHPNWSPAAIRSALMTTAYVSYKNGQPIQDAIKKRQLATPFAYGAGHVNPTSALDPGLVYDISEGDYIDFLCAGNYSSTTIKIITKKDVSCNANKKNHSPGDLNYPSFAVNFKAASVKGGYANVTTVLNFRRTLTNVGTPATYNVAVVSDSEAVKIIVEPKTLTFSHVYEKKDYTVTFSAHPLKSGTTLFARLVWSNKQHIVGSPIALRWTK